MKKKQRCRGYADLADLDEDKRIDIIGRTVLDKKMTVAVCVDDIKGKPDRYIAKLLKKFPTINVIARFKGPVPGAITIKVGPPGSKEADPQS